MASLPTRSFQTVVQNIAAGIQGRAAALIDFSVGSPLRAIMESVAGVGLWLQAMILQVLAAARLRTASGSDVDTFVQDFGLTRLASSNATGPITYSRFVGAATSPFIPVGATVSTSDGTQTIAIIADTTNVAFSPSLNGYTMPLNATSITVLGQVTTPGPQGNIASGTATVSTTSIVGIDQVTNTLAFVGGASAETDSALKARFVLFILGLSRGNIYGVKSALANLNVAIAYQVVDEFSHGGAFQPGFFYVVVDDGSGTPSSAFLAQATAAVQAVKPLGVQFSVFAPVLITANVGAILVTAPGYDHSFVVGQVAALISANILGLGVGNGLPYTMLAAWVYSIPGVVNVTGITINSATADIPANPNNRIMPGTVSVS